ncbi:MAG TPA: hypothetical protein VJW76_14765 [Verrucomicrobiae bacterium]|nr:hypothetical protein [Verrucomicrobiae bacterium]
MKSPATLVCLLAVGLHLAASLPAAVVNDGNSTNNLTRLSNVNGVADATATLTVSGGSLNATQAGTAGSFAMRNVWYPANAFPTSGVYSVSADFVPAEVSSERHGGVMGWLNLATNTNKGIAFYVRPAGSDPSFRVSLIDFNAPEDNASANENQTNLFNLDGTTAVGALDSAWAALGTNYVATNFATFQLEFAALTAPGPGAASNATARVTAKVFQGVDASTNPIPVGRTIELLTNLPLPDAANHRFGYFAVWGSIFRSGDTIGVLDNLSATGASVSTNPSTPATLVIVRNGSSVDISWSPSGYQLQMTTNLASPTWTDVPNTVNATQVTLQIASSDAFFRLLQVGVTPVGPQLSIQQSGNSIVVTWPQQLSGYRLQAKTDLSAATWSDITTTNNQHTETAGAARFFRLISP